MKCIVYISARFTKEALRKHWIVGHGALKCLGTYRSVYHTRIMCRNCGKKKRKRHEGGIREREEGTGVGQKDGRGKKKKN
jgi:hypothetical protein